MAKQIATQFVWRKNNRWWRYLPRRGGDAHVRVDLDEMAEQCATFPDPMPAEPPKLWIAWLFKDCDRGSQKIREQICKLFGKDAKPGEMHVFINTMSTNKQLWKIKHLIEIRPMAFPNGEPGPEDICHLEVMADGRCIIDRQSLANPEVHRLFDHTKQFAKSYLVSRLSTKDKKEDVYEDTVYNPESISIS